MSDDADAAVPDLDGADDRRDAGASGVHVAVVELVAHELAEALEDDFVDHARGFRAGARAPERRLGLGLLGAQHPQPVPEHVVHLDGPVLDQPVQALEPSHRIGHRCFQFRDPPLHLGVVPPLAVEQHPQDFAEAARREELLLQRPQDGVVELVRGHAAAAALGLAFQLMARAAVL